MLEREASRSVMTSEEGGLLRMSLGPGLAELLSCSRFRFEVRRE